MQFNDKQYTNKYTIKSLLQACSTRYTYIHIRISTNHNTGHPAKYILKAPPYTSDEYINDMCWDGNQSTICIAGSGTYLKLFQQQNPIVIVNKIIFVHKHIALIII